jgi:hypothetical protein
MALERTTHGMMDIASFDEQDSPLSRCIAEALIARDGPQDIFSRAEKLGLSPIASKIAVTACAATACDKTDRVQSIGFSARK